MQYSSKATYAFCFSLLFLVIEFASVWFVTDFIHGLYIVHGEVAEGIVESLVTSGVSVFLCNLFFFAVKDKVIIPYAFSIVALVAAVCYVGLFSFGSVVVALPFLTWTLGFFSILGCTTSWLVFKKRFSGEKGNNVQ
jgi:hypothetical protein